MHEKNLDHEILKLVELEPEISSNEIASNLLVPESLVKLRIANLNDTREKILVLSYGPNIYDSLILALEPENFNVARALEGCSALDAVKTEKPDLVLIDDRKMDRDCFEICQQLKSSSKYGWIPVIMLSERGDEKDRIKAFESGADDYVSAPFSLPELRARIRMRLRRQLI